MTDSTSKDRLNETPPPVYTVTIPGFSMEVEADSPQEAKNLLSVYIKKNFKQLKKFLRSKQRMIVQTKEQYDNLVKKASHDNGKDPKGSV